MTPDLRCHYHPGREAASQCDKCGDYLCAKCVREFEGQYLCAKCKRWATGGSPEHLYLKILSDCQMGLYYLLLFPVGSVSGAVLIISVRNPQWLAPGQKSLALGQIAFIVVMLAMGWTACICTRMLAKYLRLHRHHTFCTVVAALQCLVFPVGTVLGLLTLLVIWKSDVRSWFASNDRREDSTGRENT